ncbi:MAG: DUF2079 domain-containing protein [Actinomycetota bacterium]|nr:DUF2079 domain-containing protein [Actinomycetota bacterium]
MGGTATPADVATGPAEANGTADRPDEGAPGGNAGRGAVAGDRALRRIAAAGTVAIGVQFVALVVWSAVLYVHDDLASDYAMRLQAWWAIAHGHLAAPITTSPHFAYFWQDHFELINWPLAPLLYVWPHAFWLELIQCAAISGTCLVAFRWALAVVGAPDWNRRLRPWWAATVALVILLANPWTLRTASFDVHFHTTVGAMFALLTARAVYDRRPRRIALFAVLALVCGDVAGLFLIGIGISTVLVRRRQWRTGLVLASVGIAWILFVHAIGGGRGTGIARHYGALAGATAGISLTGLVLHILAHPGKLLSSLGSKQIDTWSFVAPAGILGLFTGWGAAVTVVVLLTSEASQLPNASSPFQNFPITGFMLVGTVIALGWLARRWRHPLPVYVVSGVLVANSLGWGIVWIPRVMKSAQNVTPPTAAALGQVARTLPPSAPLVMLEGDAGRFGARPDLTLIAGPPYGPAPVPVSPAKGTTYWVITTYQGSQGATPDVQLGTLGRLVGMGARIVLHQGDVWELAWTPPPMARSVPVTHATQVPAWALRTATGTPVLTGPVHAWHMQSGKRSGYVTYGAYWRSGDGWYKASVDLSSTGPCRVEVWDTTQGRLVGQRSLVATDGPTRASVEFRLAGTATSRPTGGVAPFVLKQAAWSGGDNIEIRVWAPGSSQVSVTTESLTPLPRAPTGP